MAEQTKRITVRVTSDMTLLEFDTMQSHFEQQKAEGEIVDWAIEKIEEAPE